MAILSSSLSTLFLFIRSQWAQNEFDGSHVDHHDTWPSFNDGRPPMVYLFSSFLSLYLILILLSSS